MDEEQFTRENLLTDIFSRSSKNASKALEKEINLSVLEPNSKAMEDLTNLRNEEKIIWNVNFKTNFPACSNPSHSVNCVAYYGDREINYYCLGYALGCVNEEEKAIEICFIEKRNDSSEELHCKFLPVIIDAYSTYALYLNELGESDIERFVLVSPVAGVIAYYRENCFIHEKYGPSGDDAMVRYLSH